jgi:hypothetical protein
MALEAGTDSDVDGTALCVVRPIRTMHRVVLNGERGGRRMNPALHDLELLVLTRAHRRPTKSITPTDLAVAMCGSCPTQRTGGPQREAIP